ncbi:Core-2/I-Branching enzyme [compost metagenome]
MPIDDFKSVLNVDQVAFIKNRITCNWGGNSFLQAIISSVKEVLSLKKDYDFINLLSAQDYPLTSAENIYQYFKDKTGMNFISYEDAQDSIWQAQAALRYEKYHFTDFNFKYKYFIQKTLNKIAPARKFPLRMKLYGGNKSSWWIISNETAIYLTESLTNNLKLNRFLKYSWGTDEFVLTTLIMNSPLKNKTINNNLRYIDWSEGNAHPKLLGTSDFDSIKNSKMLFARKFDIDSDSNVLDRIDRELLGLK